MKATHEQKNLIYHITAGIYHNLKNIISKKYRKDATSVGVKNRFVHNTLKNKEAPELLKYAIQKTDYTDQGVIGMDMMPLSSSGLASMTWTSSLL